MSLRETTNNMCFSSSERLIHITHIYKFRTLSHMLIFSVLCHVTLQIVIISKILMLFSHSVVQLFATPWIACSMPGFAVLHHLPEFAQIHVHGDGDAIQPSHPLSSPSPPAFNLPQHQGLFLCVSFSHQVNRGDWSFSFSISPSKEYPGLISFKD